MRDHTRAGIRHLVALGATCLRYCDAGEFPTPRAGRVPPRRRRLVPHRRRRVPGAPQRTSPDDLANFKARSRGRERGIKQYFLTRGVLPFAESGVAHRRPDVPGSCDRERGEARTLFRPCGARVRAGSAPARSYGDDVDSIRAIRLDVGPTVRQLTSRGEAGRISTAHQARNAKIGIARALTRGELGDSWPTCASCARRRRSDDVARDVRRPVYVDGVFFAIVDDESLPARRRAEPRGIEALAARRSSIGPGRVTGRDRAPDEARRPRRDGKVGALVARRGVRAAAARNERAKATKPSARNDCTRASVWLR